MAAAFERFCERGALPENQRLAAAVCERVVGGVRPHNPAQLRVVVVPPGHVEPRPSILEVLFHEAIYGEGIVRRAARAVLQWEIGLGEDVTDPQFLADKTLPDHGSLGMHLLGFPERLAKPPYVKQAKRLFERQRRLRDAVPQEPWWFEQYSRAVGVFNEKATLPTDPLLRDAVLATVEMELLFEHARGRDVRELMAAVDKAARTKGQAREDAIAVVVELVHRFNDPESSATA